MRVATLGYNPRNLATMLGWLDSGRVRDLALVASNFFRSHKGALWEQTLAERLRGKPLGLDERGLDARMDPESILYWTLQLFGATFAAVAVTFGVVIWWILRRGRIAEAQKGLEAGG